MDIGSVDVNVGLVKHVAENCELNELLNWLDNQCKKKYQNCSVHATANDDFVAKCEICENRFKVYKKKQTNTWNFSNYFRHKCKPSTSLSSSQSSAFSSVSDSNFLVDCSPVNDLRESVENEACTLLKFDNFKDWLESSAHKNCTAILVNDSELKIQCSKCPNSWNVYKFKNSYNVGNFRNHICRPYIEVFCFLSLLGLLLIKFHRTVVFMIRKWNCNSHQDRRVLFFCRPTFQAT